MAVKIVLPEWNSTLQFESLENWNLFTFAFEAAWLLLAGLSSCLYYLSGGPPVVLWWVLQMNFLQHQPLASLRTITWSYSGLIRYTL